MKKTIISVTLFLIIFVSHANKTESKEMQTKTSLLEDSVLELNSESKQTPAISQEPTIKNDKSSEDWQKKLESPILDQAKKEKKEKELREADEKEEKTILHKIAFYIPNRLLDLTDIFSLRLGFGPEASMVLTFTKWFEFGGSYGDNYFIENGYNRQYGGGYHGGYNVSLGWINKSVNYTDYTFGYTKPYVINERTNTRIPSPCEKVYKDGTLDFWKVGVHVGWLANFGVAIHPVAIANFLTGFLFIRLTDTEEL